MTLEDLRTKGRLEFSESLNEYYTSLLNTAEKHCRRFLDVESGDVVQYFDGGSRIYCLTHGPVSGVSSVSVDGVDVSWRYEERASRIVLDTAAPAGQDNVVVSYTCAFEEDDLYMQAVAMTVRALALNAQRAGKLSLSLPDGGSEQYDNQIPPVPVKMLLEPYRRHPVL